MKTYSISYDLSNPGRDYDDVVSKIKEIANGWCNPVESTWLIGSSSSASQIADAIWSQMDGNDKLIVHEVGDNWATYGLPKSTNEWLHKNWHSACSVS